MTDPRKSATAARLAHGAFTRLLVNEIRSRQLGIWFTVTVAVVTAAMISAVTADEGAVRPGQAGKEAIEAKPPVTESTAAVAVSKNPATTAVDLLQGDIEDTWAHFCSKEGVALSDVWNIVGDDNNRVLVCKGEPKGFLYSRQSYADFELTFEWMYVSDPDGNSGVLVFMQSEPRLWPTSMQVQLHQPSAGAVFPSGDAKSDNSTDPTGPPLALDVGQWNKCEIVGRGGRLSVKINEKPAGEVSGCMPTNGRIALQSEGAETHFRRIRLRVLDPSSEDAATTIADPNAQSTTEQPVPTDAAAPVPIIDAES